MVLGDKSDLILMVNHQMIDQAVLSHRTWLVIAIGATGADSETVMMLHIVNLYSHRWWGLDSTSV